MRKFAPYLFLIPPVLLLFHLPSTFRGQSAYPQTPASVILSIVWWTFLFFTILCFSRGSRLTRPFVCITAVIAIARPIYRFEAGEVDLLYSIFALVLVCVFYFLFFIWAPPFRQRSQKSHEPVA